MSYNGSGTFNINTTGQPVVAGTVISSSAFNSLTNDLATGLTTAITKDGQTTTTARITFAQGVTSSLVTDSSSVSTGSIITAGGLGVAKALYVGTTANFAGVVTLTAQPILSSLTASKPVFTDASKGLVSTGTLGADQGGTGVANNVAATVTSSGNFAFTRTLTGATNVTLPTTGTLATLAGTETLTNKTLTTPNLGTPSTLVLTNATGLPAAQLTGTQTIPRGTLPTGSVLQVVNANYGTIQTTSSSTFTDTGLTASITPTSATSKILVLVNQCGIRKDTGDTGVGLRLLRGATVILKFEDAAGNTNSTAQNFIGSVSTSYLDSPATTSATTYKTQFNSWANIANARVQVFDAATASTITLMEIAA